MSATPRPAAGTTVATPAGAAWHVAFVDGLSLWAPPQRPQEEPNVASAPAAPRARPAPTGLAANERRRAPDSVLVALQVAEQAVAMSGHATASLASVFASAHGDLPIVDALARTLAGDPKLLSPTRFHHSVHNAPSGYWAIASGSHAASTALAAYDQTFGAGLLEALVQVACDDAPVLLAGCETGAEGPLASVHASCGLLGVALVLAPRAGPPSRFVLRWRLEAAAAPAPDARPADSAQADALPLFAALAEGGAHEMSLRCGPGTSLHLVLGEPPLATRR